METYLYPVPPTLIPKLTDDTVGAVQELLIGAGIAVQGVSLLTDPPTLSIVADRDPKQVLLTYAGSMSAAQDRSAKARDVALAYRDKVAAGQTVTAAESAKALAAVITVLERLGT